MLYGIIFQLVEEENTTCTDGLRYLYRKLMLLIVLYDTA